MTDKAISPLRRRMIEDMTIRKFAPKTQVSYIRAVRNFTVFLGRSAPRTRRARKITQSDYDKKARELKDREVEISLRIEQHQKGEGDYRTTLESLISLASRAADLFSRSKVEQQRQLIAFVFSNLQMRGKKLEFSMRSPLDLMVNRATYCPS
jgi:hypothetical protein